MHDSCVQRASVSSEQRDQIRNKRWNMVICRQEEAKRIKEQSRRNAEQAKKNSVGGGRRVSVQGLRFSVQSLVQENHRASP